MIKREIWLSTYKQVNFEICKTYLETDEDFPHQWTSYLYIALESFGRQDIRQMLLPITYFTGYGTPVSHSSIDNPLHKLPFHGGITFYRKESDELFYIIKVGCDYRHLWDVGKMYCEKTIERDIKECIDALYVQHPDFVDAYALFENHRMKFPKTMDKCDLNGGIKTASESRN